MQQRGLIQLSRQPITIVCEFKRFLIVYFMNILLRNKIVQDDSNNHKEGK